MLAAGFGTRMRPLTNFVPKALFPLLDRPLIAWTLDSLKQLGVDLAIVNLHHLGEKIRRALGPQRGGVRIAYSWEPAILGTGGAVKKLATVLTSERHMLVINSDCVFLDSLEGLVREHMVAEPLATLACADSPEGAYTPIFADDTKTIVGIGEHGTRGPHRLMFLGAHMISERIVDLFPEESAFGIIDGAYVPALRTGGLRAWKYDGPWLDCGTIKLYLESSNFLLDHRELWPAEISKAIRTADDDLFICDDAKLESGCELIPPVFVGRGARVRNSTVGPYAVVGGGASVENSTLKHGIVWPQTSIADQRLERFIASPYAVVREES